MVETVWNGIKATIETVWNVIKTVVTTYIEAVKTVITTIFNAIKTTVTTIWNGIKTTISGVWEGIKTGVSGAVEAVKTKVSNVFNGIKTTVTTIWNGIKEAISKPIEAARDLVKKAIDKIKGFFDFKFTWPKIPLPHFSFSGSINPFSGDFPPKIGLKWYKQGGIFDKPSVIGVGEAGSEAVVPTHKLDAFFDEALKRVGAKNNEGTQPPFIINVEKMIVRDDEDITKVAQELERLWRRERRRYV